MNRLAPYLSVLALACGGNDRTAPAAVASVVVSPASGSVGIGQTTSLTASPRDASGNTLAGRTVVWSSSSQAVATVAATGVVTGVAAGLATITATVEAKAGEAAITVGGGADCGTTAPIALSVGEVRRLTGAERATLCVPGGASGSEYTLIAVNTSPARLPATVSMSSSNTTGPTGAPLAARTTAASRAAVPGATPADIAGLTPVAGRPPRNLEFERGLRREARDMRRAMRTASGSPRPVGPAPSPRPIARPAGRPASIRGLPATPAIGTLVTLNASSTNPCTIPLNRGARVRAVSATAIVAEDTLAPPGGFTDAEYLSIATTFDTLIHPLDTLMFGSPFDMDANGRVLLFFTTAVNERTPRNSGSIVGGFFWERDLFRRDTVPGLACATSNEGEMFYLPVVDAGQVYNQYFTSKDTLLLDINSTTIHEFQHLINASRRIWVTPEFVEDEEPWLNEAMSHLAEEALYFRAAGLAARTDLTFAASTGGSTSDPRYRALVSYQVDNLVRFNSYLTQTETTGPFTANDDALATRGASWALLRWALDHSPDPPETYLRALVNAPTQGIPNFNTVFVGVGGLAGAVRDATVAHYTDNLTASMAPAYSHLSWNFREWLPRFTVNEGRFPLATRSIVGGVPTQVPLPAGASTFVRFRVNAGDTGGIAIALAGAAPATATELILVRSQ